MSGVACSLPYSNFGQMAGVMIYDLYTQGGLLSHCSPLKKRATGQGGRGGVAKVAKAGNFQFYIVFISCLSFELLFRADCYWFD